MPLLIQPRAAGALAAMLTLLAAGNPASAAERCYDFDRLADQTRWGVGAEIGIAIGAVRVRELLVNGSPAVDKLENKFLLAQASQQIAGGARGEVYGKNVALQFLPNGGARKVSMKLAHQPGADGTRPNFVEVNGQRHEFRGSLAQMHGKSLGGADLKVELPGSSGNYLVGRLSVSAAGATINSFTLGSAELHVDDVCFEN
jgi:hypothetical protein